MRVASEQPETIHLYVVREEAPKPSWLPVVLSVMAFLLLILAGIVFPYKQPVTRSIIRVPAVLLPIRTFSANVAIIPTGIKIYPATTAYGILTITNGSVITQTIPQGFRLGNVITDAAVFVPAGSANGYGYATVPAHSLIRGAPGNMPAYSINQVEGSSVFIRNVSAFSGGRDSYTVKYVIAQDKLTALMKARNQLATLVIGFHYPCKESSFSGDHKVSLRWRCQLVTYHIPSYMHVSNVQLIGTNFLLSVWFVPRPRHIWVK